MQFRESNCISILLIHFENQCTVHKSIHTSILPIMMNRIAFVTVCCDKDKWSNDKIVTTKTKMES